MSDKCAHCGAAKMAGDIGAFCAPCRKHMMDVLEQHNESESLRRQLAAVTLERDEARQRAKALENKASSWRRLLVSVEWDLKSYGLGPDRHSRCVVRQIIDDMAAAEAAREGEKR